MRLTIFGLTLSSSWGNGHATLWRGLVRALARQGHRITFFERDVPYYAAHRDLASLPDAQLVLYAEWTHIAARARRSLAESDAAMITSYCPDAACAAALMRDSAEPLLRTYYDLDTPVTLARLAAGEPVDYLPPGGLGDFDLVLSYTGGAALEALQQRLGARRVEPLYGHVDPQVHRPVAPERRFAADLSYLGTYAADRQQRLQDLFIEPARRRPALRFVLGGSGYPQDFPWTSNIWFLRHVAPPEHAAFYSSSRLTLNVTRKEMAAMGYCPSGRLFEAAACGTPVLSDEWEGLDRFFRPGHEIILARDAGEAVAALDATHAELARIARAARERVLAQHSSEHRARELIAALESARTPQRQPLARGADIRAAQY
jgi:spore maturation protein CgeB